MRVVETSSGPVCGIADAGAPGIAAYLGIPYAETTAVHKGRSTLVWRTDITREDGKLCAIGRGTYSPNVG